MSEDTCMSVIIAVNEKRIEFIDIAKALGIIFVVAGHAVSSDSEIKRILYSFHMPLFFILSGMLLRARKDVDIRRIREQINKKLSALMLPYFVWGLIYSSLSVKHLILLLYGTRETLVLAESLSSLWFLPVLFLAFMISDVVLMLLGWIGKYMDGIVFSGAAVCFLIGLLLPHQPVYGDPWGADIAFVAAGFMLLGTIIFHWINRNANSSGKIVVAIAACVIFVFSIRYSSSSVGYVLMGNADYGNPVVFIINSMAGSLFVVMVCFLAPRVHRFRILQWIGARTMGIFIVHKPIVNAVKTIATEVIINSDNIVALGVVTLISLAASCVAVALIEHIIPEIIGLKRSD